MPNAAVLMLGASIGTDSVAWSNWATATSPGALTELYDVSGSGTGNGAMSLGAAWSLKPSSGAIEAGSVSLSASAINNSVLFAIRPSYISSMVTALTALKAHITGEVPFDATQVAAHKATIEANKWSIRQCGQVLWCLRATRRPGASPHRGGQWRRDAVCGKTVCVQRARQVRVGRAALRVEKAGQVFLLDECGLEGDAVAVGI